MELIKCIAQKDQIRMVMAWKGIFSGAALSTVFLLCLLIFGELSPKIMQTAPSLPQINKTSLGEGALALTHPGSSEFQPLIQEMILAYISTRPDHALQLTFALRSTGEHIKVNMGETVSIHSFSLTPCSMEHREVLCKLEKNGVIDQVLFSPSKVFSKSVEKESYVDLLKKGIVWGPDVFLSGWGGKEYQELSKKVKLSIGPDVFFLRPGECLFWNGDSWVNELDGEEGAPIVQLIDTSSKGAHFQVWDETGASSEKIHLVQSSFSEPDLKIDGIMTGLRPRSSTEITCQLGKRRVIVKEGDWWVRSENRWRLIRTADDLDACLHHQIAGDLFVFEKVEASKGKIVLKGQAFNRMRTSSEPISLVMQPDKKESTSRKKTPTGGSELLAKNRSKRPLISNSSKEMEKL